MVLSNSITSLTLQMDKELTFFPHCHNKKNNPHQNLPEGIELQTWNLADKINPKNFD